MARSKQWLAGVDPALADAAREAYSLLYPGRDLDVGYANDASCFRALVSRLAGKRPGEVTWEYVCADANSGRRFALTQWMALLAVMLDRGLYAGGHEEALSRLRPFLLRRSSDRLVPLDGMFCGDEVDSFYLIEREGGGRSRAVSLRYANPVITDIVAGYLATPARFNLRPQWVIGCFEASLGELARSITRAEDFCDATLWAQLSFYKEECGGEAGMLKAAVSTLQDFYRHLMSRYPEHGFFDGSVTMCERLLFDNRLHRIAKEDFEVFEYFPGIDMGARERAALIFRGYESLSTKATHEEYRFVDLSDISTAAYREAVWRYWLSSPSLPLVQGETELIQIRRAMSALEAAKAQPGYPNPDPMRLTNQEALLLRETLADGGSLGYKNTKIGAVRRFLLWVRGGGAPMEFDELFFDYLAQYEEPSRTGGESLSNEELRRLAALLARKAQGSHVHKLCLIILCLLVETEFRVSQVCGLKLDCVRPSLKPGAYDVYSESKTSNGMRESCPITETTYRHLMEAIACTEELRASCRDEAIAGHIFLYEGEHSVRVMHKQKFSKLVKKSCQELGFERAYSAVNLRDTHMTLALEHVLRNELSESDLAILSRHRHVDTTKSSYVELAIENMLEATVGIVIGGSGAVDASSHVVDELPEELRGPERAVEGGCGSCAAEKCSAAAALPCHVCEHFVTTPAHEPFFLKAIEAADALIERGGCRHDIEDLQTVKLLNALYLREIYLRLETGC